MALCTRNEVKDFYGIVGGDKDDLLDSIINQVSKWFETYCDRTFDSAEYTEYFDGGQNVIPSNYPITVVSGVWDDRQWSWASSTEVSSTYYRVSNGATQILFRDTVLGDYTENVKVIYTAGYSTIPLDLTMACIEEVVRRYKRRQEVDVTGRTMDDGSTTLLAGDILPQTKDVLNRYRTRRVV